MFSRSCGPDRSAGQAPTPAPTLIGAGRGRDTLMRELLTLRTLRTGRREGGLEETGRRECQKPRPSWGRVGRWFWSKRGDLCGLGLRKRLRVLEGGGWLDLVGVGRVG